MSKELLLVLETVANEKDISKDLLFEAMEEALTTIIKKELDDRMNIEVKINRITGEFKADRVWHIVSEDQDLIDYSKELYEDVAREKGYNVVAGDIIRESVEVKEFGRIAAAVAKQILMKKIKNFERERTARTYQDKIGDVVYGEVKRATYELLIIDLGNNAEGILPKKDLIARERFRVGDKIRACVENIDCDDEGKPNTIMLSRASNTMIKALFKLEVPEVEEEIITIVNVVRELGFRAKVTVKSNDQRIDPCGACVGVRGSRIHSIMSELNGEKVDVILWDQDIVQYAINSLSPVAAEDILEVNVDEETKSMDIVVKQESLSKAIGKNGVNVRLASALIGWKINVLSDSEQEEKQISIVEKFVEVLDVDHDFALVLIEEGIETLEDLAYLDKEELLEIEGFDEDIVNELQERAKAALLSQVLGNKKPAEDLLNMQGMQEDLAKQLAKANIVTMEDLAELSVDELLEIVNVDEQKATDLIMQARAPWFE
ncbi:transcription termination/antitermination protein NusA [Allofrancisella guangzhouensis]|uniref:Transcription termination/antitermination protein NusA n=1 Tax=Allofrancisella guangzhouensis TaxID=594679 RepID=A0A0A8E3U9_9GAMM|nr:transcription termination factor NusA [Allofrancisella guangzhouensis]AJC48297.1 transcription elongation factor NusA [Allofrancisella guangzhouensis]MBK2026617.1 transcription termination/antitermination protein NusA [Allofrancisella guangzhouensis]MBK2043808.1 transcription termination/antitermination protein NusA [Allofrancisella guangzhouensis]MBK2045604.1 transcription termination/antitermination protein NusA [Allofrancisella guangzhouensis]